MNKKYICQLCGRETSELTRHHLIPKEKGGKDYHTADLCRTCHAQIHALFTNSELSYRLYSIDKLKTDEKVKRYLNFIKDYPGDENIPIKTSKSVRRKR